MDLKINDKIAIVTGGGNGIGKAIAMRLADEGVGVIVADLNGEAAQKVIDEIKENWNLGTFSLLERQLCRDALRTYIRR